MKKLLLFVILIPSLALCQDYVDLLKVGYGHSFENTIDGTSASTTIKSFDVDLTVPMVLNEKHAFITGVNFSVNSLQFAPSANQTSLYSSLLKVGLASTYNDKWSSTIVLLPKVASDYNNIEGDDIYLGGLALLKLKKKENLIYRFGIYATTEAFGFFTTPIIGWYYLSPNKKFEMDMSLPIAADVSYNLGATTLGIDYYGLGRSFRLYNDQDQSSTHVDFSSLEFTAYLQFNLLDKSTLLRAKVGYATNSYEVYANNDKIDLGVSAFSFGDNRTQLNQDISGGAFLRVEAIYRFHIQKKKKQID